MGIEQDTPEERLLKLIEGTGASEVSRSTAVRERTGGVLAVRGRSWVRLGWGLAGGLSIAVAVVMGGRAWWDRARPTAAAPVGPGAPASVTESGGGGAEAPVARVPVEAAARRAHWRRGRLEDVGRRFIVVGIDRGDDPHVLLEDTRRQRTVFLRVGEAVDGVVVEAITERGVVLRHGSESVEIR